MAKIDNYNFAGKKAIVRVDFNVPLDENGHVTDDTRIRGALPTLKKILADGGSLILMSHMGKPKGKVNEKFSLKQIREDVAKALGTDVKFVPDCANADEAVKELKPGEYEVSGRAEIENINEAFGLNLDEDEDYETIGGLVLQNSGELPEEGYTFEANGFRFTVMKMSAARIELVKIQKL